MQAGRETTALVALAIFHLVPVYCAMSSADVIPIPQTVLTELNPKPNDISKMMDLTPQGRATLDTVWPRAHEKYQQLNLDLFYKHQPAEYIVEAWRAYRTPRPPPEFTWGVGPAIKYRVVNNDMYQKRHASTEASRDIDTSGTSSVTEKMDSTSKTSKPRSKVRRHNKSHSHHSHFEAEKRGLKHHRNIIH